MNVQTVMPTMIVDGFPDGFFADTGHERRDQPMVRVSRLEAMLADVFEKGLAAVAPSTRTATLQ